MPLPPAGALYDTLVAPAVDSNSEEFKGLTGSSKAHFVYPDDNSGVISTVLIRRVGPGDPSVEDGRANLRRPDTPERALKLHPGDRTNAR